MDENSTTAIRHGAIEDGTIVLAYAIASGYDATGLRFAKQEQRIFDGSI